MNSFRGKNVLIAGGSGLVGTRLNEMLKQKGYFVKILSRHSGKNNNADLFKWNPELGTIDPGTIPWTDYIVNLAGADIAGKRWSSRRKEEILNSRVKSSEILFRSLQNQTHHVKAVISASAIGIYGNRGDEILDEQSSVSADFLGTVCMQWEGANSRFKSLKIRNVILRIGIVLSDHGGALKEILRPFRFFMAVVFDKGNQKCSWIHLDDICGIIIKAIEDDQLEGVYNAVAPMPVTNFKLIETIMETKGGFLFRFSVPAFVLKIYLGRRAMLLLDGQFVSSARISGAGYRFKFPDIKSALQSFF